MARRIEPLPGGAEQNPPTGGNWQRDTDGGLSPADAATALAAGLDWLDEPPLKADKQPLAKTNTKEQ